MVGKTLNGITAGRFEAPRPPEGVGLQAGRLPWLGLTLEERQERALLMAKLRIGDWTVGDSSETAWVLVREDAAVTTEAIQLLIEEGQRQGNDLSWKSGGRMGGLAEEIFLGPEEPLLVYLVSGSPVTLKRIRAAQPFEFDPKERMYQMEVPRSQFGVDVLEIPLADRLVLPAGHWLQLLWINLLGLAPFLWRELAGRHLFQMIGRLGWATIRARSIYAPRIGAKLGRQGKDCLIHPTAVVEGCWLGDGVRIGANAVVRGSVLASGVTIEPLAMVEASVLAPGARVQRQALVKFSVLCDRSSVAGAIQLSVLGPDATVKHSGMLLDQALGQSGVRVQVDGRLENAPLGLAGCCIGDRTLVGAQVAVAPGRALPPDLQIVPAPELVVRRIPEGLSGVCRVKDGTLESL